MIGIGSVIELNSPPSISKKRKNIERNALDIDDLSPKTKKFRAVDPPTAFDRVSSKRNRIEIEENESESPQKRFKSQSKVIHKRPRSPSLQREEPQPKKAKVVESYEDPAYNDFNYWRSSLLDVEDVIREINADMKY